eukprot:m51a1_g3522 hypothetical protein (669) ;mRNA; r:922303-925078
MPPKRQSPEPVVAAAAPPAAAAAAPASPMRAAAPLARAGSLQDFLAQLALDAENAGDDFWTARAQDEARQIASDLELARDLEARDRAEAERIAEQERADAELARRLAEAEAQAQAPPGPALPAGPAGPAGAPAAAPVSDEEVARLLAEEDRAERRKEEEDERVARQIAEEEDEHTQARKRARLAQDQQDESLALAMQLHEEEERAAAEEEAKKKAALVLPPMLLPPMAPMAFPVMPPIPAMPMMPMMPLVPAHLPAFVGGAPFKPAPGVKCGLASGVKGSELARQLEGTPVTPEAVQGALECLCTCGDVKVRLAINPELKDRFVDAFFELRAARGEGKEGLSMAFHGTAKKSEKGIEQKGLLVPGGGSGVKHKTDKGYYGKGIYVTPYPSTASAYGTAGIVFVCAVLRGLPYLCTKVQMGRALQHGYDSHEAGPGPDGVCGEWILFSEAHVLPIYVCIVSPKMHCFFTSQLVDSIGALGVRLQKICLVLLAIELLAMVLELIEGSALGAIESLVGAGLLVFCVWASRSRHRVMLFVYVGASIMLLVTEFVVDVVYSITEIEHEGRHRGGSSDREPEDGKLPRGMLSILVMVVIVSIVILAFKIYTIVLALRQGRMLGGGSRLHGAPLAAQAEPFGAADAAIAPQAVAGNPTVFGEYTEAAPENKQSNV